MRAVILLALLAALPARAAEIPAHSLFMSDEAVERADRLAEQSLPPGAGDDLRLGAILYFGPGDWVLWLRGQKWTPDTRRDGLRVLEVTPAYARFAVRGGDGGEQEVTLRPDQSYDSDTGRIEAMP